MLLNLGSKFGGGRIFPCWWSRSVRRLLLSAWCWSWLVYFLWYCTSVNLARGVAEILFYFKLRNSKIISISWLRKNFNKTAASSHQKRCFWILDPSLEVEGYSLVDDRDQFGVYCFLLGVDPGWFTSCGIVLLWIWPAGSRRDDGRFLLRCFNYCCGRKL